MRFDTTLDEVLHPSPAVLPTLPYTHPYTPAEPLVHNLEVFFRICEAEVADPSADGLVEFQLSFIIPHTVTSASQKLKILLHLEQALGMDA